MVRRGAGTARKGRVASGIRGAREETGAGVKPTGIARRASSSRRAPGSEVAPALPKGGRFALRFRARSANLQRSRARRATDGDSRFAATRDARVARRVTSRAPSTLASTGSATSPARGLCATWKDALFPGARAKTLGNPRRAISARRRRRLTKNFVARRRRRSGPRAVVPAHFASRPLPFTAAPSSRFPPSGPGRDASRAPS